MNKTELIMGMPITIEIVDRVDESIFKNIFDYFVSIDNRFSTYKKDSEISKINNGVIQEKDYSAEMKEVFKLSEKTKKETYGYFDIFNGKIIDPSGLVKGWSILNASKILDKNEIKNYYINAGGDIQTKGTNSEGTSWKVGIKNPLNQSEIVKVIYLKNGSISTSGTYIRGEHIYNPLSYSPPQDILSISVIGSNVYDTDRLATASFAMGIKGIEFIEALEDFEGYMIDNKGIATYTSNFNKYTL